MQSHQQPEKQPQAQKQKQVQPKKTPSIGKLTTEQKSRFWLGALVAGAIAFGGWWLFPPTAPDTDNLTQEQVNQIQQEFNTLGELSVERILDPQEAKQAILAMGLDTEEQTSLEQQVEKGDLDMAWVQAWDNMAEDGDVLQFQSEGFKANVSLLNAPAIFALPLAPGQNQIKVTGVRDGGGGITASVITSAGAVSTPVIATGQSYTLPIK